MRVEQKRISLAAGLFCLTFAIVARLSAAELDIRRDATVEAVQRVMPCVVNIATETVVPIRDPLENLFRDFFNPYYRNRPADTQLRTLNVRMVPEKSFFNAELIRKKIGVSVQELTPQLAQQFAFGTMEGLLVGGVDRGSPAAAAEIDGGMLLTSID